MVGCPALCVGKQESGDADLNSSRVSSPKRPVPSATLVAAPLNSVPLVEASPPSALLPLLLLLLLPPAPLLELLVVLARGCPAARRASEPSCAADTCDTPATGSGLDKLPVLRR